MWSLRLWGTPMFRPRLRAVRNHASFEEALADFRELCGCISVYIHRWDSDDDVLCPDEDFFEIYDPNGDMVMDCRDLHMQLYDPRYANGFVETFCSVRRDIHIDAGIVTDDASTFVPADFDRIAHVYLWTTNEDIARALLLHRASVGNRTVTFGYEDDLSDRFLRWSANQFPSTMPLPMAPGWFIETSGDACVARCLYV